MFRLESSRIEDRNHLGAPIVVWTQVGSRSLAVRPTEVPSAVYAWVLRPLFVQHGLWPGILLLTVQFYPTYNIYNLITFSLIVEGIFWSILINL